MRISDWSSDVCSSDLFADCHHRLTFERRDGGPAGAQGRIHLILAEQRQIGDGDHAHARIAIDSAEAEELLELPAVQAYLVAEQPRGGDAAARVHRHKSP